MDKIGKGIGIAYTHVIFLKKCYCFPEHAFAVMVWEVILSSILACYLQSAETNDFIFRLPTKYKNNNIERNCVVFV